MFEPAGSRPWKEVDTNCSDGRSATSLTKSLSLRPANSAATASVNISCRSTHSGPSAATSRSENGAGSTSTNFRSGNSSS
eukprot:1255298-Rhodomonas_salina.1